MAKIAIGNTGLFAEDTGFGALPIQRISKAEAVRLLRMAFDGGITYYDTARAYTDSEEKLGEAFPSGDREKIIIATKVWHFTEEGFWDDLHTNLKKLRTDYIDIYQFHNPSFCPRPDDGSGMYEAMLKAKEQGKIRHIAITNHRMHVAEEAVKSGLYTLLQFPFNYLSTDREIQLVKDALAAKMGFSCMKGMSGGLINSGAAATVWMRRYPGVMPIWGVQREEELREFLSYINDPPKDTEEIRNIIDSDRAQLQGDFCRACGYCMPCPQGIQIPTAARMSLLLRRAPTAGSLNERGQALMARIDDCIGCGQCASKCPYGLDTPELLKRNLKDYKEVLAGKPILPHNY